MPDAFSDLLDVEGHLYTHPDYDPEKREPDVPFRDWLAAQGRLPVRKPGPRPHRTGEVVQSKGGWQILTRF